MTNFSYNKYINFLIIGYAFTVSTTIAGIVLFQSLLIASFLIHSFIENDFNNHLKELKKSKIIIALSLLIVFSLISVLWSSDKIFALLYINKYWHFLTIPVIYLSFNPKYLLPVISSFLAGMFLSEVLSYGILLELIQFNNILPSDPSPFMNHIDFSLFLAFTSMILLNRIFFTENIKLKLFYLLFFITTVTSLFLNAGRTGQIIFVAVMFIILFLNFKNKIRAVSIAAILSMSVITISYNASPVFNSRATQAYNDVSQALTDRNYSGSFGIRNSLWIMGLNVFSDNFLLGTGIGDEKTGMQQYAQKYNITRYLNTPDKGYIDYHNLYIQHAVQMGIIGLILTLYLFYTLFSLKFIFPLYSNISIVFATSVFIYSTAGNVLHTIFPMTFFAFFVAILSALSRHEQQT